MATVYQKGEVMSFRKIAMLSMAGVMAAGAVFVGGRITAPTRTVTRTRTISVPSMAANDSQPFADAQMLSGGFASSHSGFARAYELRLEPDLGLHGRLDQMWFVMQAGTLIYHQSSDRHNLPVRED